MRYKKKKRSFEEYDMDEQAMLKSMSRAMPLLNTPFVPGRALDAVNALEDADARTMALAEYYYFSGQSEKASNLVEKYLESEDPGLKLSACWIYGYANLALDRTYQTAKVMQEMQNAIHDWDGDKHPNLHALAVYVATAAATLLHLPLPKEQPQLRPFMSRLPRGLRMFAAYVQAHQAYLQGHYHECVGIAEATMSIADERYPIPMIYLHMVATMGLMRTGQTERAREHMVMAWQLAQPDDFIEPFGEHHGLIGGMLEVTIKKDWPDDFRRMIAITYSFSAGWREIHALYTGKQVADDLTTTEFTVAMLAAQNWSNKEIGAHLGISTNTVKQHVSTVLQKLDVSQRKDLAQYLLH